VGVVFVDFIERVEFKNSSMLFYKVSRTTPNQLTHLAQISMSEKSDFSS